MPKLTAMMGMLCACVGAASADDGRALLQKGTTLYREASYAASVAALEQARAATLSREERAESTFYLAAGYVALGSLPAARRELRDLVASTPEFEMPRYTPPKVAALFQEAQRDFERLPRLGSLPARKAPRRVELRFEASRTNGPAFGSAYVRWKGEGAFREVPLQHVGDELVAPVPVSDERRATTRSLEFWAMIESPGGAATLAEAQRPLELAVAIPARRSGRGWVWVAVGGALAGVGLGLGLGLGLRSTAPATADGIVTVRPALVGQ